MRNNVSRMSKVLYGLIDEIKTRPERRRATSIIDMQECIAIENETQLDCDSIIAQLLSFGGVHSPKLGARGYEFICFRTEAFSQ